MSSVDDMMKKAVTTAPEFYSGSSAVEGFKDRKERLAKEYREKRNTLSQWYGIKRVKLTEEQKQDLELLKYRNFVNPNLKHQAPKKSTGASTDFVEFGFMAGTGRNKRRRYKSFADEWIEENPDFADTVSKRVKRNIKVNKKNKELAAKRAEREKEKLKMKGVSKRKTKNDDLF